MAIPPHIETAEDLERIVAKQNELIAKMGELVKGMDELLRGKDGQPGIDERLTLLTALVDHHHTIFIKHGWAPPRPKGDKLAN